MAFQGRRKGQKSTRRRPWKAIVQTFEDTSDSGRSKYAMSDRFDCVVCGELCLDLPIRPINQHLPLRDMGMVRTDAIHPGGGGIVANSGMAMARLGLATAALACIGNDVWGDVLAELLRDAGLDTSHLLRQELGTTGCLQTFVRWPSKAVDLCFSGRFDGLGRPSYRAVLT